jgi:prolyl-tRNA synthetase
MLRAGLIRQLGAGIYSKLPLAERVARKVEAIVREEMSRIGAQEFRLPLLHPAEPWKESGRWDSVGEELFRLRDRKQTDMALAMTAEEIFTTLARDGLRSYRQLHRSGTRSARSSDEPARSRVCCAGASSP